MAADEPVGGKWAEILREAILKSRYSLRQLAKMAGGMSVASLSRFMAGRCALSMEAAGALAEKLGISLVQEQRLPKEFEHRIEYPILSYCPSPSNSAIQVTIDRFIRLCRDFLNSLDRLFEKQPPASRTELLKLCKPFHAASVKLLTEVTSNGLLDAREKIQTQSRLLVEMLSESVPHLANGLENERKQLAVKIDKLFFGDTEESASETNDTHWTSPEAFMDDHIERMRENWPKSEGPSGTSDSDPPIESGN